jgi:hypothetical protein
MAPALSWFAVQTADTREFFDGEENHHLVHPGGPWLRRDNACREKW